MLEQISQSNGEPVCEDKVHEAPVFEYRPGTLKGGISTTPMDAKGPVVV